MCIKPKTAACSTIAAAMPHVLGAAQGTMAPSCALRATPALPEWAALRIKRSERKLKNNAAHQQLLTKWGAEHRGQDGEIAGVAHARLLDKLAVVGRGIGQQRQHGVGHVTNDYLQGQANHDNAGDAFPRPTRSPAEWAFALPARHEGAGPQITPPQQRHQK